MRTPRKASRSAGLYIAPPAVSPDGRFILMQRVKRPYSYWVRYREFSVSVEIWDRQGRLVRTVADLPSTDQRSRAAPACLWAA